MPLTRVRSCRKWFRPWRIAKDGPKLKAVQGCGKLLGKGLLQHVGIDGSQVAPDRCQKLVVRKYVECTISRCRQCFAPSANHQDELTDVKLRRYRNGAGTSRRQGKLMREQSRRSVSLLVVVASLDFGLIVLWVFAFP